MALLNQLNTLETSGLIRLSAVQPELEYLFRHALVQDAAYGSLLRNHRRQLHQNVGEALERLYSQQLDEIAATLALHFEKAEQRDKAVYYFRQAGDRASEGFANTEALAFYQSAIAQAELALQQKNDDSAQARLAQLLESLADVHERIGQHEAAREVYYRVLEIQAALLLPDNVTQARLYRKIGTAHTLQRQFEEANRVWDRAELYLGDMTQAQSSASESEWIALQTERVLHHYWINDPPGMKKILDRLLPVAEQRGTVLQRAYALYGHYLYLFRVQRYVVSDEVMAMAMNTLPLAEQAGKLTIIFDHNFTLGFFHLNRRELGDAEKHLHTCLTLAERMGDPVRISRAANYLMVAARMRGLPDVAQSYFETVLSTTWAGPMADYTYVVQACQSWIAWREGRLDEARKYGLAAREALLGPFHHWPFQWVIYFPLLAVATAEQQVPEAIEYAKRMIDPKQMILPEDLTVALARAIQLGEAEQSDAALQTFAEALKLANEMGYV